MSNNWFITYHWHHLEKLGMIKSTYDLCFFFCNKTFAIIGLQIDEILIFATNAFTTYEKKAIQTTKIMTKPRE